MASRIYCKNANVVQEVNQIASGKQLYSTGNSGQCFPQPGGVGWGVGGRLKKEGIYVYL